MKIVIVGPGAIGCLFAAKLAAGGQQVLILDKNRKRASFIKRDGIRVSGLTDLKAKVGATSDYRRAAESELVIFSVKSYDLEEAAGYLKKSGIGKNTFCMGLQNGLGNTKILSRIFGRKKVLAAVTNQGSTLVEAGYVRHAGKGTTYLGSLDEPQTSILKKIKMIFNECDIETEISHDINSLVWGKLMINVGINAITAICRIKNGQILEIEEARQLMTLLVKEASKVAGRLKIKLPFDNAVKQAEIVCHKTARNISSMLQDVQRGRRTEIDFINGAIVKQARALNLAVPHNEAVTYLVKAIEKSSGFSIEK